MPGRPRQMGRNQMALDLSRQDVRESFSCSQQVRFNAIFSVGPNTILEVNGNCELFVSANEVIILSNSAVKVEMILGLIQFNALLIKF